MAIPRRTFVVLEGCVSRRGKVTWFQAGIEGITRARHALRGDDPEHGFLVRVFEIFGDEGLVPISSL